MHYTGMAALEVTPGILDKTWMAISVGIALAASLAALWLTFRLRQEAARMALMRLGVVYHHGHRYRWHALRRHGSSTISNVDDGPPSWS